MVEFQLALHVCFGFGGKLLGDLVIVINWCLLFRIEVVRYQLHGVYDASSIDFEFNCMVL